MSQTVIPAHLPEAKLDEVKTYAAMAYTALNCEGLARCDFFVDCLLYTSSAGEGACEHGQHAFAVGQLCDCVGLGSVHDLCLNKTRN